VSFPVYMIISTAPGIFLVVTHFANHTFQIEMRRTLRLSSCAKCAYHFLHDGPIQDNSPKTFLAKLSEIAAASQSSKNVRETDLDGDTVVS
jgi:hypothetical protein